MATLTTVEISCAEQVQVKLLDEKYQQLFLSRFSPARCETTYKDYARLDLDKSNWIKVLRESPWEDAAHIATLLFEYFQARGDWEIIRAMWNRLAEARVIGEPEAKLKVVLLHQLGILLTDLAESDEARHRLDEALALAQTMRLRERESSILYELGVYYRNQGQYKKAENLLERALQLANETGDIMKAQFIIGQLANLQAVRGNLDQAVKTLEASLQEWQRLENEADRMMSHTTLHALGRILIQQHRYEEAEGVLTKSLAYKQRVEARADSIARTQSLLAEVYVGSGRYQVAEEMLVECIQTSKEIGDYLYLAVSQKTLAFLRFKQRRYREAEVLLTQASGIALRSENPPIRIEVAVWRILMGMLVLRFMSVWYGIRELVEAIKDLNISPIAILRLIMLRIPVIGRFLVSR